MAPAILETPNIAENFNDHKDGLALEATDDAVHEVNLLKAEMRVKNGTATQEEVDMYEKSKFDEDKDKTQFRNYEDACDRVKNFYKEQHTKQTVAYNLKARNDFKFKTRSQTLLDKWNKLMASDTAPATNGVNGGEKKSAEPKTGSEQPKSREASQAAGDKAAESKAEGSKEAGEKSEEKEEKPSTEPVSH